MIEIISFICGALIVLAIDSEVNLRKKLKKANEEIYKLETTIDSNKATIKELKEGYIKSKCEHTISIEQYKAFCTKHGLDILEIERREQVVIVLDTKDSVVTDIHKPMLFGKRSVHDITLNDKLYNWLYRV